MGGDLCIVSLSLPSTPRKVPSGHGAESSILYLCSPGVRPKVIVRPSGHPLIQDSLTLPCHSAGGLMATRPEQHRASPAEHARATAKVLAVNHLQTRAPPCATLYRHRRRPETEDAADGIERSPAVPPTTMGPLPGVGPGAPPRQRVREFRTRGCPDSRTTIIGRTPRL